MSGLIADSRTMVDKARVEGQVGFFHSKVFLLKKEIDLEKIQHS